MFHDIIPYYLQKFILLLPVGLIAYFSPLVELAIAVGLFIVCDTITGIWAARKQGERIHSSKTRRLVAKLIAYLLALILAFIFDNHIVQLDDTIYTTRAVAFVLSSIEIQSNLENLYKATGLKLWDRLKHLFSRDEYEKRTK